MNTYCLKCKKLTKHLNSKGFVTKNKKYIVKSICNICKSKKSEICFKKRRFWLSWYQISLVKNTYSK